MNVSYQHGKMVSVRIVVEMLRMTIDEIFDYLKKHPEILLRVEFPDFVVANWSGIPKPIRSR